jgi:hypothetical protein
MVSSCRGYNSIPMTFKYVFLQAIILLPRHLNEDFISYKLSISKGRENTELSTYTDPPHAIIIVRLLNLLGEDYITPLSQN